MPSVACWIQNPDVVGVPAASAQNVAMSSCACVRVSEIARISLSSARNAVDPNAGGGADRNWLAEVRNQGRTPAGVRVHGVPCRADRKSTRLNSSHQIISYAVFCLKKK